MRSAALERKDELGISAVVARTHGGALSDFNRNFPPLDDRMVDRNSGQVLSGGPDEATEAWTFTRTRGGPWLLSAIQQV